MHNAVCNQPKKYLSKIHKLEYLIYAAVANSTNCLNRRMKSKNGHFKV